MERDDDIMTTDVVEQDLDLPVLPQWLTDLVPLDGSRVPNPYLEPLDPGADPIRRPRSSQGGKITTIEDRSIRTVLPITTVGSSEIQTIETGITTVNPNK